MRLWRLPTTSVQPPRRWNSVLVADMSSDENAVLRLRICGHADCRAVFTICVRCDRGQRYCGPKCRSEVRQRQRQDANRRYQQSEPGRESHRRCQKRYRDRALRPPLIDHGAAAITPPAPLQAPPMCQCTICGRHSLWNSAMPVGTSFRRKPRFSMIANSWRSENVPETPSLEANFLRRPQTGATITALDNLFFGP